MTSAGLRAGDGFLNLCETAGEGEIKPLEKVALTGARLLLDRFRSLLGGKTKTTRSDGNDKLELTQQEIRDKNKRLKNLRQRLEKKDLELARLRAELAEPGSERRLPSFFDREAPVFFVVGQGKSGTTWVRNTLNSHPEILCRGEGRFFERDFVQVAPLEDLRKGWLKSVQPTSLYGAISSSEYLRTWMERSVWTDGEDVDRHLGNLSRLAVNYFLTQRLSKTEKKIVGDKTTFSGGEILKEIGAIYPEAKVIHVIRDGRDVAVSMIHHMWNYAKDAGAFYDLEPEDLEKRDAYRKDPASALAEGLFTEKRLSGIARSWATQVGKAVEYGPTLLGDNYAEVRYEELLKRPEDEIGRLLRFLEAEAGEETVKRCIEMGSFERWSEGRERGREDSFSFYRRGVAGDWRNVFTEEDRRVFKEAAGEVLIQLGYERDDDW
jgi:Sulfotransferase domain